MSDFRSKFRVFGKYPDLVYLDTAASAQKLDVVVDKVADFMNYSYANINRGMYQLSEIASAEFELSRKYIADFINARSEEIIFTKSATESINLIVNAWGRKNLNKNDAIVLSLSDHHASIVPWLMLSKEIGFDIHWLGFDKEGFVDFLSLNQVLSSHNNIKLVSVSGVSNVLGQICDLRRVSQACAKGKVRLMVDACQMVVHQNVDVRELECDFLVFSSHKIYGPSGVGILYVKQSLLDSNEEFGYFLGGGDAVEVVSKESVSFKDGYSRFEAGTQNIEGVVGCGVACRFMLEERESIMRWEEELMDYLENTLFELDFVEFIGPKSKGVRAGLISFNVKGVHAHDVAQVLADNQIAVRAGQHCAHPLYTSLNISSSVRVSLGVYNSFADIDKLVDGLKLVYNIFRK